MQSLELSNLQNSVDAGFMSRFVNKCTRNSEYTLSAGAPSEEYIDIDKGVMDPAMAAELAENISEKIRHLIKSGNEFEKIAFIDDAKGGPVGMINLHSDIVKIVGLESIIIRPYKELIRDSIKGNLGKGDRVLILNDVATTGETIFDAAEKVWRFGGKVPYALVFIDRGEGGKENLMRKGIKLFSMASTKSINENLSSTINQNYHLSLPVMKDFGGTSYTFVR